MKHRASTGILNEGEFFLKIKKEMLTTTTAGKK